MPIRFVWLNAPGDRDAAFDNQVCFYPIVVGKEGESWRRLKEEAFPRLLSGEFDQAYQEELLGILIKY